ncbi:hypothetical protein [Fulvivirga sp.]|uniref:hypothetical protein n=1 Tax=Fulvivirga sp. TaxID=1931237 RepID=UPI0032ECA65F
MNYSNKVAFSIGTGRCGTKFLYELLSHQPNLLSHHERLPLEDSFYRYAEWNQLKLEHSGYFHIKAKAVENDLEKADFSFESSAYLSLAVKPLFEKFNAKFILLVRAPHAVVTSYHKKGWYQNDLVISDYSKAPGFQPKMSLKHHSFSRIVPIGNELKEWEQLTQIGKLSWYYQALNSAVLKQFEGIPNSHYKVIKLEDLDYQKYLEIADFLSLKDKISEATFHKLTAKKVNTLSPSYKFHKWSETEKEEFFQQTRNINKQLNYTYSSEYIKRLSTSPKKEATASIFQRIRNKFN